MTEAEDVRAVLAWLLRHPVEFRTILTLARLAEGQSFTGFGEAERKQAKRWLSASTVDHCAECYEPVVILPDYRVLTWPDLAAHSCQTASAEQPRARGRVIE